MNAIFRREYRRQVRSWIPTALAGLAVLSILQQTSGFPARSFRYSDVDQSEAFATMVTIFVGIAAAAFFTTYSVIREEKDGQTLELLATTPVGGPWALGAIALGRALAWLTWAILPVLVMAIHHPGVVMRVAPIGVATTLAAAGLASMGAFHFGKNIFSAALGLIPMTAVLVTFLGLCGTVMARWPAPSASVAILLGGYVACVACFSIWRLAGGHWPETILRPPPLRPKFIDEHTHGVFTSRWWGPVPDGVHPVLWRELQAGATMAVLIGAAVAMAILLLGNVYGAVAAGIKEAFLIATAYIGMPVILLTSASRSAADRESGFYSDLASTPLRPSSVCASRLAGLLARGLLALAPGFLLLEMLPANADALDHMSAWAIGVEVLCVWSLAGLVGHVGGLVTRGWKAGGVGALIGYLICLTACAIGDSVFSDIARTLGFVHLEQVHGVILHVAIYILAAIPLAAVTFALAVRMATPSEQH